MQEFWSFLCIIHSLLGGRHEEVVTLRREKGDRLLLVPVGYHLWVTSLLLLSGLNIYKERSRDLRDGLLVNPSRREAF